MKEKTKRNKKIYQDRKAGMSWRELIQKHDLSIGVLRIIVNREKLREKIKIK